MARRSLRIFLWMLALLAVMESNPDARSPLPPGIDMVLIGDSDSEHRFLSRYRAGPR